MLCDFHYHNLVTIIIELMTCHIILMTMSVNLGFDERFLVIFVFVGNIHPITSCTQNEYRDTTPRVH
jgi:hypothetical protein